MDRRKFLSKPATETAATAQKRSYLTNATLTNYDGRKFKFYDDLMKGKIAIVNMMYAKCDGICMPTTMNLVKVQKLLRERYGARFGREIVMYSATLKPEQDSAEVLRKYAITHGAGPGWLFLTGKPDDIEQLRRAQGYVDLDPQLDKARISHTGNVRYGNEARTIWSACPGLSKPAAIVEAISWVDWPKSGPDTAGKGEVK